VTDHTIAKQRLDGIKIAHPPGTFGIDAVQVATPDLLDASWRQLFSGLLDQVFGRPNGIH